jgi:Tfp pilus assembly PilM family ATPase
MPRVVYFEWDQREARAVVCEERGERVKVLACGSTTLEERMSPSSAGEEVGRWLKAWLSERKLGRPAAVAVLDRTLVETCLLELPPASDAELPEMVANQALRQSHAINEDSTLDFLPFPMVEGESRRALAAAISAETLGSLKASLKEAGLRSERLLVRSFGTTRFVMKHVAVDETALIICPAGECVDMTLVSGGHPVLMRTVRPPSGSDRDQWLQRVLAEVKRTLVAAPSQSLQDGSIDRLVLLTLGDDSTLGLGEFLQQQMTAEVQLLNVRTGLENVDGAQSPADESVIAPAFLGLLATVRGYAGGRPDVNLLSPRRPPRRLEKRQVMWLAAAAGLLLVGGIWYWIGSQLSEMDAEIARLQARRSELDETLKRTSKQRELAKELRGWETLSVNWLEELRDFSGRIPDESQLVIQRMSLTPSRDRGGAIDIQGVVRDPATVTKLEQQLRDTFHEIRSKRVQERGQGDNYAWHFESAIAIKPRSRDDYAVDAGVMERSPSNSKKGGGDGKK